MRTATVLLLLCALGCGDGAFVPLTLPTDAPLSGVVVDRTGNPVAGTTVYVVRDERPLASVVTRADGAFVFEDAPTGRAAIVVHDGAGVGTYEDVTVYAGGNNYIGAVRVGPLRLEPRVLDIHDVGFEERIVTTNETIIAVDDRGWVLTVESTLLDDPMCPRCDSHRFYRRSPDRRERTTAFGGNTPWDYLVDGDGIWLAGRASSDLFELDSDEPFYTEGNSLMSSPLDATGLVTFEFRDQQWIPVSVTRDGSRHEGDPISDAPNNIRWLGVHDGRHYFAEDEARIASIGIETGDYAPLSVSFEPLRLIDAALGEDEVVAIVSGETDARIVSLSLSTETRSDLYVDACPERAYCLVGITVAEGIVSTLRTAPPAIVVVQRGVARTVALDVEPASPSAICFEDRFATCSLHSAFAGHLRIESDNEAALGERSLVDFVDGSITRTLAGFRLGPDAFQVLSIDETTEVVSAIEPNTEFRQLHIGPIGRPLADMRRLTHLHVDHVLGGIDRARGHALYTIEDPVHPGGALFKVGMD